MAGKYPDIVIYVSDKSGKHNFKESTIALWKAKDGKVDSNGNPYWTGCISSDPKDSERFVLAYKFVPKDQRGDEPEPAGPSSFLDDDDTQDPAF